MTPITERPIADGAVAGPAAADTSLSDEFAALRAVAAPGMTDAEADAMQQWAGMDGAVAFHLIERHADNWNDIGQMMDAWLRANTEALRAALLDEAAKRIPLMQEAHELRERMAELEQDAARYRFLESDFSPMGLNIDGNHAWAYRRNAMLKGPSLSAAIDAAMKG